MEKSYAERADSGELPPFDPERQFDRDIERYLKEVTEEEVSVLRKPT